MSRKGLEPDSPLAAKLFPSPNHGERKDGEALRQRAPDMLILHYTGMPEAGEALQWLCNPVSRVSCHYFVFENGQTLQLVPEARRAWHAGVSAWGGERDINSCSIGIEIANPGHGPDGSMPAYQEAQIAAVTALCREICARLAIPPQRVLAHSDIAPGRKIDPGETFPWRRLAEGGAGLWVTPAPIRDGRFFQLGEEGQPIQALQSMFALFGYDLPITGLFDPRTKDVVAAFQRHWRPEKVDGVADASTITTLRDLLREFPSLG